MLARIVTILLVLPIGGLAATDAVDPNTPAIPDASLFSESGVLELSLSVDFDALCRPNEVEDCNYSPAILRLGTPGGVDRNLPVELRVRGGWRARRDHCEVPPLFVRFAPGGAAGTPFAGQDLLPLTTHCRRKKERGLAGSAGADYEQYVLKEYLGYRLYNLVSDRSLRVRLVRINYSNPAQGGETVTRYAFFTEHFDSMAARLGFSRLPGDSFDHEKIDLPDFDRLALFNFMIGNTDWSVVRQRNIVLLADGRGRQYPVPFDLDMSGLVDAEYGGVSPRLDFRDPRHRHYLGFCHPGPDYDRLFGDFESSKDAMLELVREIPGMDRTTRKVGRRYLDKFFDIIESPADRQQDIIGACQPWPPSPVDHTTPPDPA